MKQSRKRLVFLRVLLAFTGLVMGGSNVSAQELPDPARLEKWFAGNQDFAPWGPPPLDLGRGHPDWDAASTVSRGNAGQQAQLATVIIVGENSFGSGAVISPDGWILTNYHVIESEAQTASVTGQDFIRMSVVTCERKGSRVSRREKQLSATVYRADPVHDLALLKLDSLPAGLTEMPYFKILTTPATVSDSWWQRWLRWWNTLRGQEVPATPATAGDPCMVVGSPGGSYPWAVRSGSIAGVYNYPEEITNIMVGVDPKRYMMDRLRLTMVMSTCSISGGDSGGPLLSMDGDLIGLTFATPNNDSRGSVGYHIDLADIQEFLRSMPLKQEQVPFDVWKAGFPEAFKGRPDLLTADVQGQSITYGIRYDYFTKSDSGSPIVFARQYYMDFDHRSPEIVDDFGMLPVGLWGMEKSGNFRFDLSLTVRRGGVLVTGYPNEAGTIDEMRIDVDADLVADLVWVRAATGSWSHTPGRGLPLVAKDRLEPLAYRKTTQMMQSMLTGAAAGSPSGRKP